MLWFERGLQIQILCLISMVFVVVVVVVIVVLFCFDEFDLLFFFSSTSVRNGHEFSSLSSVFESN